MSIINFKDRQITYKIVYYGPGYGGKTTNIQMLHQSIPDEQRSKLQSVDTEGDRTLFFDQFDVRIDNPNGLRVRFMVYGVPGQSYYKTTRRMVLQGCDGIVFVADSTAGRIQDNIDSMDDLEELLTEHNYDYYEIPLVIQYNKRDLPEVESIEDLEAAINKRGVESIEGVAVQNEGVQETFKAICKQIVAHAAC